MKQSEKNAWMFLFFLCVILIITIINVVYTYENRDLYFKIINMDMPSMYDIFHKTALPMKYETDCEDWCNNEPSCQAYVINSSMCYLKNFNKGQLTDNSSATVFLRQTPDLQTVIGTSFTSIYPNTCIVDSVISTASYLSPIDCMNQCISTPDCTGFVMTSGLHSSPYICFLHSGSLENTATSSYSYFIPLNISVTDESTNTVSFEDMQSRAEAKYGYVAAPDISSSGSTLSGSTLNGSTLSASINGSSTDTGSATLPIGRYLKIIAPQNSTQSIILSNIQAYSSKNNMDTNSGLLNSNSPVTTYPTPLQWGDSTELTDQVHDTYIVVTAVSNAWVKIDITSNVPIYSVVITNRSDGEQYALVGCTLQILSDTNSVVWSSNAFPDSVANTNQIASNEPGVTYASYQYYIFYPPSNMVNGSGAICGDGFHLSNDTCITCDPGYVSINNNTSCTKCPGGTIIQNNICSLCPVNNISNIDNTECIVCDSTKIIYNNDCVVGGRYLYIVSPPNSTRSIQLNNIQAYSTEDNFNNGIGLLTATSVVTANPGLIAGNLQSIVTPSDSTYIIQQAAPTAVVSIDIGMNTPIYCVVIKNRIDAFEYALVGCFLQIWDEKKLIYYQSDNFPDPNGYTGQYYTDNQKYPSYKQYNIYPKYATVYGVNAICPTPYSQSSDINECIIKGRYITIIPPNVNYTLVLSNIQAYSSQANMSSGVGLLTPTSTVTASIMFGLSPQNIVTPLNSAQIASPDGSKYSKMYITANAGSLVKIDIGSDQPVYSIVIKTRLDAQKYELVGCFVQLWDSSEKMFWQSDKFTDPYNNSELSYVYDGTTLHAGYTQYVMYLPSTKVTGLGPVNQL